MCKRLLIILFGILVCAQLQAATVDVSQAEEMARSFFNSNKSLRSRAIASSQRLSLAHAATAVDAEYYVFNRGENDGFVVVSGDDLAPAVLGYSDEGSFDYKSLPENARAWFDEYARQIAFLRNHPSFALGGHKVNTHGKEVEPLLDCIWNQDAPFNDLCPMYDSSNRCVTGCVATATAQVMYLHKWPPQGTGSHSYTTTINGSSQTLSADFAHAYDWDNMKANYHSFTAAQGEAVAQLMSDVGIAIDMGYGLSSGAATGNVALALPKYFGYDASAEYIWRDAYLLEDWEQMIVDECDNGRAVIYSGFASSGGHAFVLDGYDADGYFHVNWGWGGKSNGYFMITALNPRDQGIGSFEGGYNSGQGMVRNVMPDQGGVASAPYVFVGVLTPSVSSVALGSSMSIVTEEFTIQGVEDTEECYFAFVVSDLAGEVKQTYWIGLSSLEPNAAYYNVGLRFAPSTDLADGQYYITYWAEIKGAVSECQHSVSEVGYIEMTVSGGTAYFVTPAVEAELSVTSLTADATAPCEANIDVTATVANSGDEYYNYAYAALLDGNNEVVVAGSAIKIDVPANGTATVNTQVTAPATAGTYTVVLLDASSNVIAGASAQVEVVAADAPKLYWYSDFTMPSSEQPASHVQADLQVINTGGLYKGNIELMVVPSGAAYISQFVPVAMIIGNNEVADVHWEFSIPGAEAGEQYSLYVRDPHYTDGYYIWGDPVTVTIAAELPRTALATILTEGVEDESYRVNEKLTIVKSAEGNRVFATDGNGNWIAIEGGEMQETLEGMTGIKGGTLVGRLTYENGNAVLTEVSGDLDEAEAQEIELREFDLTTTFDPQPNEIVVVSGYYQNEQGGKLRAYSTLRGKSLFVNDSWLGSLNLVEGGHYTLTGAIQLLEPWDSSSSHGAPRRMDSDDKLAFQNYVIYPLEQPAVPTAVDVVKSGKAVVATTYVDMTGRQSDKPWRGNVNVVVTRYADGSTEVTKVRY